jgi:hypothetical protein
MKMPWAKPVFNEVRLVSAMGCHFVPELKRKKKIGCLVGFY